MAADYNYDTYYLIAAIAPDGEVVDHNMVAEDDLDMVSLNGDVMPKGSYLTCLPVPRQVH